ncbi:MAG: purine-nucleoside/S-methyl-5-thioadenosine phosphorylase / adenosine deaminase [Acetobacteraceae bacterium]|jgi:YfiH family protein|nr:purine-nucleoside/S-methyl-5-thioadenosine phosphorylase / adenosine deaminase [Acetobacteraceae bacterium]
MAEALTADPIKAPHGFFTRRGGVSTGPYASLNCSLSSKDDRQAVLENRARVACSLDTDPDRLLGLTQVHGIHVVTATAPWAAGQGEKADAMVTAQPGLALGIVTADCAPVLFADRDGKVVGAAHAGWRGAVAGVLEATIAAMTALGTSPDRITAAVGPCIAQTSYEVGPDLRDAVLLRSSADQVFFAPGRREDRWQFDLAGYCAARLTAAGLGHVIVTGHDTLAGEDRFFSHRRRTLAQQTGAEAGPIGHQISVIRPA